MAPSKPNRLVLIAVLCPLFASISVMMKHPTTTPSPGDLVGLWAGTLKTDGPALRFVLRVTADPAGHLTASLVTVDQGETELPTDNVVLKDNYFSFTAGQVGANYAGTLSSDRNTLTGTWSQGKPLPLVFHRTTAAAAPRLEPTPTPIPARPPVALRDLKPVLDQELKPVLESGLLSNRTGGGMVIGVLDHGERRIFAYGSAHPDSIFEIGSITKTFTGLILAQMVVQKKVSFDDPVRTLLMANFVAKPAGPEITLLDLATHHAGLPRDADNLDPRDLSNPYRDFHARQLEQFLNKHGLARPAQPKFLYSNVGFGLLGYALSWRAGVTYEQLLQNEITEPLHLQDTVVTLSSEQWKRLIQGYSLSFAKTEPFERSNVTAGAGAIKSTASDMLTYLDANLHPGKYSSHGAAPDSPAATLSAALAIDHEPRADADGDKIALAWIIQARTKWLAHNGGTFGYGALVGFSPADDVAVVVLYNRGGAFPRFVDRVGANIGELLTGRPCDPIDYLSEGDRAALAQLLGKTQQHK